MCESTDQIKAVQDYYAEGQPLAERLAWQARRLESTKAEFDDARVEYERWEQRHEGTIDHPVAVLVRALQTSVDYVPPGPETLFRCSSSRQSINSPILRERFRDS